MTVRVGRAGARGAPLRAFLLLVAALALCACSGGGSAAKEASPTAAGVLDPAARGPYGVGVMQTTFTRPASITGEPRPLPSWIWYPTDAPGESAVRDAAPATHGGPFPVVVFSHGSGGLPELHKYLTEHLASWGYVVVAPSHTGNTLAECLPCDGANTLASARQRPGDVTFVLDEVLSMEDSTPPIGRIVDGSRTAIAGHSFGGWTAMFVAPGGRFNAAVSLAPGQPETLYTRAQSDRIPTLIMGGAKDQVVPAASVDTLFASLPAETAKTYVSLPEGHHLSFIDRCLDCTDALPEAQGHEIINRYVTAFLQVYLAGDERYRPYLDEAVPGAELKK